MTFPATGPCTTDYDLRPTTLATRKRFFNPWPFIVLLLCEIPCPAMDFYCLATDEKAGGNGGILGKPDFSFSFLIVFYRWGLEDSWALSFLYCKLIIARRMGLFFLSPLFPFVALLAKRKQVAKTEHW